jgi:hypothetical protein
MTQKNWQEKGKQMVVDVTETIEEKSKQAFDRVSDLTQTKATELTEDTVVAAVDRAVEVIQIASDRIREKELPTENVALEVDISIAGIVDLKMKADVPTHEQILKDSEAMP